MLKSRETSKWGEKYKAPCIVSFFLFLVIVLTGGASSALAENRSTVSGSNQLSMKSVDSGRIPGEGVRSLLKNYQEDNPYPRLEIIYPKNNTLVPSDIAALTFEWKDPSASAVKWVIIIGIPNLSSPLYTLTRQTSWTPDRETWELMKRNSRNLPVKVTILGVSRSGENVVSKSDVKLTTSPDPVGGPIMFRRVPPDFAKAAKYPERMEWVLADLSSYESPSVVMSKQPICGSCHTFSRDGSKWGMDMDYRKSKGAYFVTSTREKTALTDEHFIDWNEHPRSDGLRHTGLYPRLSPDGNHVAATVNEIMFLIKIPNLNFSQLFFPLQGNLAIYSLADIHVTALPGADRDDVIQTDPSWSPDGTYLLFSRAPSQMDLFWDLGGQTIFSVDHADIDQLNRQYPIQFDIYRIPFNNGEGGLAEPVSGASHNGKSNYYPRISPDGRWIVFTQSETGLAIQQDSKLVIMENSPGAKPRVMNCNLSRVNSWHTWSPNSKWLAFVSKENTPYTELFLTHIDANGKDSPPIFLKRLNKPGYAINVPEFANIPPDAIREITLRGY